MNETFLNSVDLSHSLHCNTDTVRRIIRSGELKALKVGRCYLVRQSALDEYLASKEVTPTTKLTPVG